MRTSALRNDRNLFVRLYKHRPREHHTPQENFVTESFAISLSSDRKLLEEFFVSVLDEDLPDNLYIDTQVKYQDVIFDIVLSDGETLFYIIECKMNASFSQHPSDATKDQLDKYAETLAGMDFERKGIVAITVRNPPQKKYKGLVYTALRWVEVMSLFKDQELTSCSSLANTLREQFVELLEFLKVDRTLKNNRLLWKCDICGLETNGQGILSHKNKHCREYAHIIERENRTRQKHFFDKIDPYREEIDSILLTIRKIGKIEMGNFRDSDRVFEILESSTLPQDFWMHVANKLELSFSNKAFLEFRIRLKEVLGSTQLQSEPQLIMNTYENILLFKDKMELSADLKNVT